MPCPPPYARMFSPNSDLPATVCCPGSPEESVPPPVPAEPSIVRPAPAPVTRVRALHAIGTALTHQLGVGSF